MLVRVTSNRILVKIKKVIMNLKLLHRKKKVFSPGRELSCLWSVSWLSLAGAGEVKALLLAYRNGI